MNTNTIAAFDGQQFSNFEQISDLVGNGMIFNNFDRILFSFDLIDFRCFYRLRTKCSHLSKTENQLLCRLTKQLFHQSIAENVRICC